MSRASTLTPNLTPKPVEPDGSSGLQWTRFPEKRSTCVYSLSLAEVRNQQVLGSSPSAGSTIPQQSSWLPAAPVLVRAHLLPNASRGPEPGRCRTPLLLTSLYSDLPWSLFRLQRDSRCLARLPAAARSYQRRDHRAARPVAAWGRWLRGSSLWYPCHLEQQALCLTAPDAQYGATNCSVRRIELRWSSDCDTGIDEG